MRKHISLILAVISAITFSGCGSNTQSRIPVQTTGIKDVLASQMSAADGTEETSESRQTGINDGAPTPYPTEDYEAYTNGENGIDFDLTVRTSNMVYAEVYNMMIFPKEYDGKTIKIKGLFTVYHDEAKDKYYFACFVSDAAACCRQGIEFILKGDHKYPDDYPQEGSEICITGVFGSYEEDGNTYYALTDAVIS